MTNKKFIWIVVFFSIISSLIAQENSEEVFFKETYLVEYDKALRSSIKENKISFANKIFDESSVLSNISIQKYTLLKAAELVDGFSDGYPLALKIHEKVFDLTSDSPELTHLIKICALIEDYARSLPSSKKDERADLYEKQLQYTMLQAQILIKKYLYADTIDALKKSQHLAKTLDYDKTYEMIREAIKLYTPYQSKERNLKNNLEKIEQNLDTSNNISSAVDILLYEFGNVKYAILLALRLDDSDERKKFAVLWRKFRAKGKKASKSNIYFKESDLDKSDHIIFSLLLSDASTLDKAQLLFEQYKKDDKKPIIDALKLGEKIIDTGEEVIFSEYDRLVTAIETQANKANSIEAKIKILELTDEVLNEQLNDRSQQDDVTHAKIKIKIKEISNLKNNLTPQRTELKSIPVTIKKPDFAKLDENGAVKKILALINAKTYHQKDITDYRKLNSNLKAFFSPESEDSVEQNPFDKAKWGKLDTGTNNFFNISAEKESVSIFNCYIHSEKTQKTKLILYSYGKPFIYVNTKAISTRTNDQREVGETVLSAGENSIRIIVFHTNQGPITQERLTLFFKGSDNKPLDDIKSSTKTYRQ